MAQKIIWMDRHGVVYLSSKTPEPESESLPLPDGLKPNPNGEPDAESLKEYAKKHPHKDNDDSKQK